MPLPPVALILTCEHAGHSVPPMFRHLFRDNRQILQTHEGYDIGALAVARNLARSLSVPLFFAPETRLLIDQNRSLENRNLFSRFSQKATESQKNAIIADIYRPHRERIIHRIRMMMDANRPVLHCAIHSFTPVLHGRVRSADIGILYDPSSSFERRTVKGIRKHLTSSLPDFRIRFNYPYRGTSDGLTTSLRVLFGRTVYAGIEIEINQALFRSGAPGRPIARALATALHAVASER
jgi:predicted N-formylglutamate amidohydrolase